MNKLNLDEFDFSSTKSTVLSPHSDEEFKSFKHEGFIDAEKSRSGSPTTAAEFPRPRAVASSVDESIRAAETGAGAAGGSRTAKINTAGSGVRKHPASDHSFQFTLPLTNNSSELTRRSNSNLNSNENANANAYKVKSEEEDFDVIHHEENDESHRDPSKRRKNTEASARFRLKRKQRAMSLMSAIEAESVKIEDFKNKMRQLEIENDCLKKIIIGKPTTISGLDLNVTVREKKEVIGSKINSMSNYELLKYLKK
ncbi:hypothetical protein DAMA08_045740 [Martiniozyma asiatica (nom. inval.)]|nr:hypothetical protein DAMA08_045740 [Martiniozyma asiatica]